MDRITELKQYALEQFEKRKNFSKLKKVNNVILDAIYEIIDNYSQYIDKHSIDKALRVSYKIKIYNEKDSDGNGFYIPISRVLSKSQKDIYGENGTILVYYPFDEYSEKTVQQNDEFDLQLDKKQTKSFKDYIVDLKPLNIKDPTDKQKQERYNIRQNYFSILQHEILHSMCKKELIPYSKEIEDFFCVNADLVEEPVFYLFDGGFPLEITNLRQGSMIDYDNVNQFYLLQLHEGLTEYLSFSMKKEPIKRMSGFQNCGEEYISPTYGPFVWFVGALNTLINNKLIDAYFSGKKITLNEENDFHSIIKNIKPFLECLTNITNFAEDIDYFNLEILNFDPTELYQKLYDNCLSSGTINKKIMGIKKKLLAEQNYAAIENDFYQTDYSKLTKIDEILHYLAQMEIVEQSLKDNISEFQDALKYEVERFDDTFKDTLNYLYENYKEKIKDKNFTDIQKKEFMKCFRNLTDFNYTWDDYLYTESLDPYYFDLEDSIKKMNQEFNLKENEEQIENRI